MAFGSKIKGLWEKGKSFLRKAAPTIQKVVKFVGEEVANGIEKFGGPTGEKIAPLLRKGAQTVNGWFGKPKGSFDQPSLTTDNPPAPI